MTIDLKPEQQRVIDLAVQSGAYQNPGEVLDQAFEISASNSILKTGCSDNARK
jgi:Arc/MetJ-type ribon-helix-helix transcriptional regulator